MEIRTPVLVVLRVFLQMMTQLELLLDGLNL
jgi:hypothetical protein